MMDPVARFFEKKIFPKFRKIHFGRRMAVALALVKPGYSLLFLLFTCMIQTIDGYVIKPKFFGNSLGVSSLWILITIICGGKMFGVVGVLLAIPFAAIVQYLLEEIRNIGYLKKEAAEIAVRTVLTETKDMSDDYEIWLVAFDSETEHLYNDTILKMSR